MKRITIGFILISLVYGEICKLDEQELTELEKSFNEAEIYMRREASNENAAICIGTTRAGKSTLINYLIGNELKAVRFSRYGDIKIIKADNRSIGPEIGAGPTSKTTIPTKWTSKRLNNLIIFDSPGFQDNRGPIQEITNSFYLYQLAKNVNSLKFILVINFADIERDIITPFMNLLLDFDNFFGNKFKDFFQSISVIFSKVPYEMYDTEVDIEMIKHLLKTKAYLAGKTSSNNVKDFLSYITENNDSIALFKTLEETGTISDDIELNIFSSINNSKSVNRSVLQSISPSISHYSFLCLLQSKNKWVSMAEINEIQESLFLTLTEMLSVQNILTEKLTINQISSIKEKLSIIENLLNKSIANKSDIYENIETLKKIDIKMQNKIDETKYLKKVKIFMFVSNLLHSNESEVLKLFNEGLMLRMHAVVKENEVMKNLEQLLKNRPIIKEEKKTSLWVKVGKYLLVFFTTILIPFAIPLWTTSIPTVKETCF
ncbi:uncharacterized protein LOC122503573 [Leptopilina heterotoma]|uniref:uncharacterized protein LOC122503573 n=1 Tax=Leptopilina heterotoma TaxID=63436 RepID=UPI001CA7C995|nr:uncharacterized protein LOC122503573 [Leptopilina heterotoma]XP_043470099.1 uncharacterized protein LOC122503573 [Leptopilina heterotoma]XP_043470100.1 uncharacterized protein LOC122503573 [Leptopilina heterotoma]